MYNIITGLIFILLASLVVAATVLAAGAGWGILAISVLLFIGAYAALIWGDACE